MHSFFLEVEQRPPADKSESAIEYYDYGSDDDEIQVIAEFPSEPESEPKVVWQTEPREEVGRPIQQEACVSVKPKYPKKGEQSLQMEATTSKADYDGEMEESTSVIPKWIVEKLDDIPQRKSQSEPEPEEETFDAILRQDDPVQILNAVSDDCGASNGNNHGMRDMFLAMHASISDLFGGPSQHPQMHMDVQHQQPAAVTGVGMPQPHHQNRPMASPQNFLQINVNIPPAAGFGFRLQPPVAQQQRRNTVDQDVDEEIEEDFLNWD